MTATAGARRVPQDRKPKTTTSNSKTGNPAWETPITARICGQPVTVAPIGEWRQSAQDALRTNAYNDWVVKVMSRDDAITWFQQDPTNSEVVAFLEDWESQLEALVPADQQAQLELQKLRFMRR